MSIAVFGSAFDPPHLGHADVVAQLLARHKQVLLVPSAAHAFGKRMSPFEQRLELVRALVDEQFGDNPTVDVSAIESELLAQRPQRPVYSIDLLEALQQRMPGQALHLVLGPDNAAPDTFRRFHGWQEIEDRYAVDVVAERLPIHSSQVRKLCCTLGTNQEQLQALTGEAVGNMIIARNLYRASGSTM